MKLELSRYRSSIPGILNIYNNNPDQSLGRRVTLAAVGTNVPVVACFHFIAETYGMTQEIQDNIDRLTKFYKYSKVEE